MAPKYVVPFCGIGFSQFFEHIVFHPLKKCLTPWLMMRRAKSQQSMSNLSMANHDSDNSSEDFTFTSHGFDVPVLDIIDCNGSEGHDNVGGTGSKAQNENNSSLVIVHYGYPLPLLENKSGSESDNLDVIEEDLYRIGKEDELGMNQPDSLVLSDINPLFYLQFEDRNNGSDQIRKDGDDANETIFLAIEYGSSSMPSPMTRENQSNNSNKATVEKEDEANHLAIVVDNNPHLSSFRNGNGNNGFQSVEEEEGEEDDESISLAVFSNNLDMTKEDKKEEDDDEEEREGDDESISLTLSSNNLDMTKGDEDDNEEIGEANPLAIVLDSITYISSPQNRNQYDTLDAIQEEDMVAKESNPYMPSPTNGKRHNNLDRIEEDGVEEISSMAIVLDGNPWPYSSRNDNLSINFFSSSSNSSNNNKNNNNNSNNNINTSKETGFYGLIQKGDIHTKLKAQHKAKIAKINNWFQREEALIQVWENEQLHKASSEMKKLERKLEEKRAKAMEKMQNDIAKAHRKAEERRASAEAKRGTKVAKVFEVANLMRAVGRPPVKRSFF